MIEYTAAVLSLSGLSFLLALIWGEPLLRVLRHYRIGKVIRVEGPERHFEKMGTPTMGGVMIILPVVLMTLLLNAAPLIGFKGVGPSVLVPTLSLLIYGFLGAVDDWEGVRGARRGLGMRARTKFAVQMALGLVIGWVLKYLLEVPDMYLPGVPVELELGWFYVPLAAFLVTGFSNAVNLTDGLDGLAGLIAATAFGAYGGIALLQGQIYLAQFSFLLVGAIFGFLWFNVHPAQLFMGDTGSLALGATLAVVALMTGHWPLLALIGVIPLSETLSVMLQVAYFKWTGGKRLFKMAPLHHHFELSGWSETQVVQRFWLIGLLAALFGVGLAML